MAPNQHNTANIRHETPNKNKRLHLNNNNYDDDKSRRSALKSVGTGQSNTRVASYPDKRVIEDDVQVFIQE